MFWGLVNAVVYKSDVIAGALKDKIGQVVWSGGLIRQGHKVTLETLGL